MNPWNYIPLKDYELHMSDNTVGQLVLLNSLTKKYLKKIRPSSIIIPGIAGGNGLEHIDPAITQSVIGIDINQHYLNTTYQRYHNSIPTLQLICCDLTETIEILYKADMIWAALVVEYTGMENSLAFAVNHLNSGGHFVVTIQSNNHQQSISDTGIESVKKAETVFQLVDSDELIAKAADSGFSLFENEENCLPNGKSLITFHFVLKT